ncbi:MAG: transglutaminase-like domain-containing protein, partial [Bacteriovorax sp.]
LILDYLSTHYTYDYEMVKNNNIRPLTTEEAFSRGKGVCQHYAVIFTTIARALKIPTRIVMGYLLGNGSAGSHAWVEAEVLPGVWRVIEPQSQNGLTQTHTRFYFPTARAKFLENKNSNLAEYITLFVQDHFTFRPN